MGNARLSGIPRCRWHRLNCWKKLQRGNQQRKTRPFPADKLASRNFSVAVIAHGISSSAEASHNLSAFSPARVMARRKRAAARTASNAVTGPCTTGYGPCIAGKKNTDNTQTTAKMAKPHPIRSRFIAVWIYYTQPERDAQRGKRCKSPTTNVMPATGRR